MSKLLTPDEVFVIQMALIKFIEENQSASKNQNFPFTPQARKELHTILTAAQSALSKISHSSGQTVQLDPYKEGDEKEFLTKPS
ncbi:MAG: hypothetical protein ABI921_00570 [Panacibacter sp.]